MPIEKKHRLCIVLCIGMVAVVVLGAVCWLIQRGILDIPCLFRKFTGLLCPGCGNTGAARALLRLDFAAAFQCNPLCFLEFGYIGWVLGKMTVSYVRYGTFSYHSPCLLIDGAVLTSVFLWWGIRNFL